MAGFNSERVIDVKHWTDTLFSFRTTRDPSFRFRSGQFTMIGLMVEGRPLLRAYSLANAVHEDVLEFFSIKVQNGPLTSRLQNIQPGDELLVGSKSTGTLVADSLLPGRRLLLLSTGTGLAPFASVIKDPEIYDLFDKVILAHGCRHVAELAYGEKIVSDVLSDEILSEMVGDRLAYYPTVTREPYRHQGRLTDLLASDKLFADLGLDGLDIATDRVMLCGSPDMLKDLRILLEERGFEEGSHSKPGHFVIERAFVER
ncbi:MAG: ferredoxin--NADP reductase [Beijerinckiaceae bacterium]|jgi:ferredoxin/flavodoxin---NADP+ reductase|nr:ferredoxin--NADP reductase [Beijerinckiaceae bacterium]